VHPYPRTARACRSSLDVRSVSASTLSRKHLAQAVRRSLLFAVLLPALIATPARAADSDALQDPALKRLYAEFQLLFRKYYPNVTSHLLTNTMHFEHDTRAFIVHEPLRTGEWQDPRETRGPKLGGILCDIALQKGPYQGAAMVPQTFDKRYFRLLIMAPYSRKHDAHLYVHLAYPGNVSGEFLRDFTGLVTDFERHLD
jgi:hypothetical protein